MPTYHAPCLVVNSLSGKLDMKAEAYYEDEDENIACPVSPVSPLSPTFATFGAGSSSEAAKDES